MVQQKLTKQERLELEELADEFKGHPLKLYTDFRRVAELLNGTDAIEAVKQVGATIEVKTIVKGTPTEFELMHNKITRDIDAAFIHQTELLDTRSEEEAKQVARQLQDRIAGLKFTF
jgi:hypothetical protein